MGPEPLQRGVSASHSLDLCVCVTPHDAPDWLIYVVDDGALGWCRHPAGVKSRFAASGHADPAEVLRWLQGKADDPWGGGGGGDGDWQVLPAIRTALKID